MPPLERLKADHPGLMLEIQDACLNQQAFLFVRPDAGWVLKPLVENGVVGVLVWAAWSERRDGLSRYQPEIEQLTRQIGGRWLRFHTRRRGFLRMAPRLGWRRVADSADGSITFQLTL
ncbi:hypothetical protein HNR62_001024 [Oceanisphaera litoralis]|uniref:hypothetical protein n=1 Tax=Oceanisphaera litoralis TaxID=225144 RepID=UPI0019571DE5|nr:hypothetical protein [Oceanisphaera litoralis]MBM7455164.1 hypothetical protein [Oceanisphaera litoralis]